MPEFKTIEYKIDSIEEVAKMLWSIGKEYTIWVFNGEMGAGKTTLIRALGKVLEIEDNVNSPSFSIVNEYHFALNKRDYTLFHADWYRLQNVEDAYLAGMTEILNRPNSYTFIEWASQAIELITTPYFKVDINFVSDSQRSLSSSVIHS